MAQVDGSGTAVEPGTEKSNCLTSFHAPVASSRIVTLVTKTPGSVISSKPIAPTSSCPVSPVKVIVVVAPPVNVMSMKTSPSHPVGPSASTCPRPRKPSKPRNGSDPPPG